MKTFICDWEWTVILITIIFVVVTVVCSTVAVRTWRASKAFKRSLFRFITPGVSVILWIAVFFLACSMPLTVSFNENTVCINRIKGSVTIPLKDIVEVRSYDKTDFKNAFRKFGSGGAFGFTGDFEDPQLGDIQMCVMNKSEMFMLRANNQIYVVSCKDSDVLVNLIKDKLVSIF